MRIGKSAYRKGVTVTPIKRGNVYYAVWSCIPGQCQKHSTATQHWMSLRTGDKREAKAACDTLAERLDTDKVRVKLGLPVQRGDMSLAEFRGLYLESTAQDKAESTHKTEACHIATLVEYFGDSFQVQGLTQDVLEGYKRNRLNVLAPRSWNSHLGTLRAVFAWGLRRQPPLYAVNPFLAITRVDKGQPTIQKYVTKQDLVKVIRSCREPFWVNIMAFLYATWCRGSELRELKWSDVHTDLKVLEFRHPKERRLKKVPITPALERILQNAARYSSGTYVFPGTDGGKMTKDSLHHKLQGIGHAVNVKLSPHMLRHSGITDALVAGAPLPAVQQQAGHSQLTTTAGYAHMTLDAQRGAMDKLNLEGVYDHTSNTLLEGNEVLPAVPVS